MRYGTRRSAHSTLITVVSAPRFALFPAHLSECVMCTQDAEEESALDHSCIESSSPLQPKTPLLHFVIHPCEQFAPSGSAGFAYDPGSGLASLQ